MPNELSFWNLIRDQPESVEPLLVYADWLEDHNDPRAQLVRTQAKLLGPVPVSQMPVLKCKERYLIKNHRARIIGPVRSLTNRVEFRGGMIIPELSGAKFLKHHPELLKKSPTVAVRFARLRESGIEDCKALKQLRGLDLSAKTLRQGDRIRLLQSKYLSNIVDLDVGEAVGRSEFADLFRIGHWPKLERIRLNRWAKVDLLNLLRTSVLTKQLKHLNLAYGQDAISAFSNRKVAPKLETLIVNCIDKLEKHESLQLPSLRVLDSNDGFLSPTEMKKLLADSHLPKLESLAVLNTQASMKSDTFAKFPPRLKRLSLRQCSFSPGSAIDFVESKLVAQLESLQCINGFGKYATELSRAGKKNKWRPKALGLSHGVKSAKAVESFAKSGLLNELESLDIGCSISAAKALAKVDMPKLRRLSLADVAIDAKTLKSLFESSWFSDLQVFEIHHAKIKPDALSILPATIVGTKLKVLAIGTIRDADAQSILRTDWIEQLEFLGYYAGSGFDSRQTYVHKDTTKQIKKRVGGAFEDLGYSPSYANHMHHVVHPITGSY